MDDPAKFLEQVIRQRKKLIRLERSKVNKARATRYVEYFDNYLGAYRFTPEQARLFIKKNVDKVSFIMPGPGSRAHKKCLEELSRIINH